MRSERKNSKLQLVWQHRAKHLAYIFAMIRKCKNISITDPALVSAAIFSCLKSKRKRERSDTIRLVKTTLKCSRRFAARVLRDRGLKFIEVISILTDSIIQHIKEDSIQLPPVRQRLKIDGRSGKTRIISLLDIQHFLYEYVVVFALNPLFARVGEYQVSAIKGRGTGYGAKAIKKWLKSYRKRVYAVKLDVKNFYGSIDRQTLLNWLQARISNRPLMCLMKTLLSTIDNGIPIGSFLSQTLANIYLSDIYHMVMERTNGVVHHALFYMDDMLLIGQNKRKLNKAVHQVITRAVQLGLCIKDNWCVYAVDKQHPIDMMGFRFSKDCTTIRKRIFVPARHAICKLSRLYFKRRYIPDKLYRRAAAYYGYFKNSDSCKVLHNILGEVKIADIFKYANEI